MVSESLMSECTSETDRNLNPFVTDRASSVLQHLVRCVLFADTVRTRRGKKKKVGAIFHVASHLKFWFMCFKKKYFWFMDMS